MKNKITFSVLFLSFFLCLSNLCAETKSSSAETKESKEERTELILKAGYAGLSYKKSVLYADLTLQKESADGITEKQQKKLDSLSEKIAAGEDKISSRISENNENAALIEAKNEKIKAKFLQNIKHDEAVQAYEDYVYRNEKNDEIPINPKTGFPEILSKPFITFDEGAAFAMITRLQKQDKNNRSNFVWQDYLIGAYFDVSTVNLKPFNDMIRISVFYPFYHTFDGMQQYAKQTILYAIDLYAGPTFQFDLWNYVYVNFSGGLHYMYQLSDEYHLNYLGMELLGGFQLPIARRWTIIIDGAFTLDYPNFGTNKKMQPFDYSWQYQAHLGVRYSKKSIHKYAYIHKKINKDEKILKETTKEVDENKK